MRRPFEASTKYRSLVANPLNVVLCAGRSTPTYRLSPFPRKVHRPRLQILHAEFHGTAQYIPANPDFFTDMLDVLLLGIEDCHINHSSRRGIRESETSCTRRLVCTRLTSFGGADKPLSVPMSRDFAVSVPTLNIVPPAYKLVASWSSCLQRSKMFQPKRPSIHSQIAVFRLPGWRREVCSWRARRCMAEEKTFTTSTDSTIRGLVSLPDISLSIRGLVQTLPMNPTMGRGTSFHHWCQ